MISKVFSEVFLLRYRMKRIVEDTAHFAPAPSQPRVLHKDLITYKCRLDCLSDFPSATMRFTTYGVRIYEYHLSAMWRDEEQCTEDEVLTFKTKRDITLQQLVEMLDKDPEYEFHVMSGTLELEENYTGKRCWDRPWDEHDPEEERGSEQTQL